MSDAFDNIADALGHRHRRMILSELLDRNPLDATGPRLRGPTANPEAGGSMDLEGEQIALHHNHLPRLEASGYVDWNPETGTVVKGPNWDEIGPVLELIEAHSDRLPVEWP